MRRSFIIAAMVLFNALPVLGQAESDGQRDIVRAVVAAVGAGMEAGDFASLDTLFSDSRGVHIIEGAGVDHGWADYRDHHLAPELEAFENFSYRWFAIEPVVDGNAAWASFRYELSAQTERGTLDIEGRGTVVLQRTDRWRVVHLHTSGRPRG